MATNVGALRLRPVGKLDGVFRVPAYQRGYRWGDEEVNRLLDDLWEARERVYCLQPVVVRRDGDGRWELIDGQQRLTTLYLVFRYMERERLKNVPPPYRITYDTRARSEAYLRDLDDARKVENIDFFHMHGAFAAIAAWFAKHPTLVLRQSAADELFMALCKTVQVIWYEAPQEVSSHELFRRLNVGRIPLTDAELLKAVLLKEGGVERPAEVAVQWDAIEQDLGDPDFWAFITPDEPPAFATRIDLLFSLCAPPASKRSARNFATFDALHADVERDRKAFWDKVLGLHALLREWYDDREVYHVVGFLIAEGESLRGLVSAAQSQTRRAFRASLTDRVRAKLKLTPSALDDLTFDKKPELCRRALRLMNIVAAWRLQNSSERHPFRADKAQEWSLEHVHAQNAEVLRKAAEWTTWLDEHRLTLEALPPAVVDATTKSMLVAAIDAAKTAITAGEYNGERFESLAREVIAALSRDEAGEDGGLHSIFNLALLPSASNSALSNSTFAVKRRLLLERERRGDYIPLCTRRVFLKYFTDADAQHVHFWSRNDRVAYRAAMHELLTPYLLPETTP
ncbi:MAG: DUF262 domain-containing protein [Polyangiales bacterium]